MVSQEEATPVVFNIPKLPTGTVKDFVSYVSENPKTPIARLLEPYKAFESELRKVYAQQPSHEAVKDGGINLVPIFAGHEGEIRIRPRRLDAETEEEKGKYIMSLKDEDRKPEGAPAVVSSFKDFQQNFNLFSESSLTELNWNNVVAAGTAVTTALLPVPHQWAGNKRTLRTYYHEHLAPASDVDLFLYGLNEEQAIEKIKQIERSIKDSILHETITVRTKNAITIASQHPTRHVQIVLRLYDFLSQIVTGFDVDCACAVYDGKQVYAAPRAVVAFMTQCNTIDLGRRSPSYESRLSKYSRRGFEIYWPLLDRSLIDPTIFERSFGHIQGLARLLVLEKLPTVAARDSYTDQRRRERGRPARRREVRNQRKLVGNIKDQEEEEIAEWAEEDDGSSYHTLTIPYGPKFHASRINRLLYAKDLLLNAEWNQNEERKVYLHRHPCFIGTAEEVIQDCCGFCPVPRTDEEIEIADEEKKRYISGKLTFLTDNPGRQEIGSFHPINDDEWATTAYVGDTARLCQAIVDRDLEYVRKWCAQKGVDVNRRDYTGRTPLHLAAMSSSPEIVRCLINAGARLVARLVDGQTALHIAATRGSAEIVKALMNKSLANEEEEDEKDGRRRAARREERQAESAQKTVSPAIEGEDMSGSEASVGEGNIEKDSSDSLTMGSFVKIDKPNPGDEDDVLLGDATNDPDIYDINVVAWDYGLTPLHFAVLKGHLNVIELLISEYGADVLLPVKLDPLGSGNSKTIIPKGAIITITLAAMCQPTDSAIEVARLLLKLGATSAQSDMDRFTVLHTLAAMDAGDILDSLFEYDRPAALSVLNSVGYCGKEQAVETPLSAAINRRHGDTALRLLKHGAKPMIAFEDWVKYYLSTEPNGKNMSTEQVQLRFMSSVMQPLVAATIQEMGGTINGLIAHGADPCTLGTDAQILVQKSTQPTHNFFRPVVTEAVLILLEIV